MSVTLYQRKLPLCLLISDQEAGASVTLYQRKLPLCLLISDEEAGASVSAGSDGL